MRIEEDWERVSELDQIYLIEHQKEIEAEWQFYEEEQNRKPAIIKLINSKKLQEDGRNKVL